MGIHPWISMEIHGYPSMIHGYPWISMDDPWISMDDPWTSMDTPWIIHGYPRISVDYLWISRILFVTKWHATQVERISTRPISMIFVVRVFANVYFCGCPLFICMDFRRFNCILGRSRGPLRIGLVAAGATKYNFGSILCSSDFPRNPKIMKINFSSVSCDSFQRNSARSMRNRSPVIFQPSGYNKNSRYTTPAAVML